jgi:hypothetical protein
MRRNWDYEPNETGEVVMQEIGTARAQDLPAP